jgi:hypothetical protein
MFLGFDSIKKADPSAKGGRRDDNFVGSPQDDCVP